MMFVSTFVGNRTLHGNDGDDVIFSGFQNDKIYGDGGNDVLFVTGFEDYSATTPILSESEAYGGADNDVLFAGNGISRLYGGAGHDVLHYDFALDDFAFTSEAHFWGGEGDDFFIIQAPESDDSTIYIHDYGIGNDLIYISDNLTLLETREIALDEEAGTRTVHHVYGFTKLDEVFERLIFVFELPLPASPDDLPSITFYDPFNRFVDGKFVTSDEEPYSFVVGSEFDDVFALGNGNDYAYGQQGNDTITSGGGNDYIYAGEGDDVVEAGAGNDFIFGQEDYDVLYGDSGNDHLYGDGGNDRLFGGEGNDHLYGGDGTDTIIGGTGNDYIEGGAMKDALFGGEGADIFSYFRADIDVTIPENYDVIEDFELGVDRISLGIGFGADRDNIGRVANNTPTDDVILFYRDPDTNVRSDIALLRGISSRDIIDWEDPTGLNFYDEIILTAELV